MGVSPAPNSILIAKICFLRKSLQNFQKNLNLPGKQARLIAVIPLFFKYYPADYAPDPIFRFIRLSKKQDYCSLAAKCLIFRDGGTKMDKFHARNEASGT
ncbi:MAG: hypothetical protein DU430_04545 [Candidatus Tokpelaia sp.]|nr:MAG: hypothetical protein DU430_04545 [Candidatus Tokpelaia sp.]